MNKQEKKQYKSAAKQIAREALHLVITARKKDLDEERRAQIRLNRGHDSAWAEANYASKFISAVYKEIGKMGVELDDLVISEQLSMERLVSDRAKDVAFAWASFEAQKEAAAISDANTHRSYARKINVSQVRELLGDYLKGEELTSLLDDLYHDCDDDSCVTVAVESIRALVEARQDEAAKAAKAAKDIEAEARAEKLVRDATKGTMNLAEFREYVNSGTFKREVEDVCSRAGIFFGEGDYVEVNGAQVNKKYADIVFGEDEPEVDENKADTDYEDFIRNTAPVTYALDPDEAKEWLLASSLDWVTVDPGESLKDVAETYGIEVEELVELNPFLSPDPYEEIEAGTVLNLPANTPFPLDEDGKGKTTIVFSDDPGATRYEYDNGLIYPVVTDPFINDEVVLTTEGGDVQVEDEAERVINIIVYPGSGPVDESYNEAVANMVAAKIRQASKR